MRRWLVCSYGLFCCLVTLSNGCSTLDESLSSNPYSQGGTILDSSHIQNPNDQREMKAFKLANDLEVLLIHEPSLNKSSASMDVAVGSLDDPEEHLGLAHFLEHMLFLGTEKYPSVDEYSEFLATHQGYSNAYTASEDTNYLFEVNHDGFEGALDRFAQFFISPTFDAQFTERERNAVHSEHQKNIENDDWREMMLRRSLHREGHPRRKFSTGDLKTLGNVDRKVLVDFYNRYYSANQMKLALMSKHSLADMEQWVRAKFVAVKNQQAVKPQYPQDPFAAAQLPLLVEIKPVKDLKKLNVMYALPSQEKDWQHKSLDLISTVLGFEGEGSILSYLKAQNLATGLGVGTDDASYSTSLYLEVQLTDKGLQHWQQVAETIHAYIAHMREQGFPEYVFTERQRMAEINFTFREFREGAYVTSQYARQMHRVPALEIDRANELYYRFDRTQIQALLAELVPENAMYFLSHKSAATDLTERYYGTPYRTEKLAQPLVNQWRQAKLPHGLTLPKPNPFIPEKLELLTAKNATQPQKIIDQDQVVYWFQQDDRFKVPKAYAQIHLLTPVVNSSAANKALSLLYSLALAEALNEWNYTAMLAGLHFSVGRDDRGLVIDLFGYAEKMPDFLRELTKRLRDVDLDPDHFRALKTQFKRDLANANLENAYQVGMYEMSFLVDKNKIHRDEIYAPEKQVDLITAVDIRDVKSFARNELYKMFRVEAAVYGSMQPESLGSVIAALPQLLDAQPLSVKLVPENEYVFPAEGQHAARALEGFTPNHCWAEQILLGEKNPSLSAALLVGHALLKTSFFSELRTKQQLGYVVHSSPRPTEKTVSMLFLIQSSEYAPGVLAGRVQEWKKQAIGQLKATPEELLAQVKKATATELREQEKTMAEKHQSLVYETLSMKGHLGYQEEVAVQVEELTLAQVIALYEKMFQPQTSRSVSVYLGKKGYNTTQTDQALHWVEDAVKYKSQQPTL